MNSYFEEINEALPCNWMLTPYTQICQMSLRFILNRELTLFTKILFKFLIQMVKLSSEYNIAVNDIYPSTKIYALTKVNHMMYMLYFYM